MLNRSLGYPDIAKGQATRLKMSYVRLTSCMVHKTITSRGLIQPVSHSREVSLLCFIYVL